MNNGDIAIYPREGTETSQSPCPARHSLHIAIYPREGTETQQHCWLAVLMALQFIPARGRKLPFRGGHLFRRRIAIYPRKGTETCYNIGGCFGLALQFIPARGRKHEIPRSIKTCCVIAIYPREGTETLLLFSMVFPFLIAIYPREGTETRRGWTGRAGWRRLQFIPARGRKRTTSSCKRVIIYIIAIYPREGTETTLPQHSPA